MALNIVTPILYNVILWFDNFYSIFRNAVMFENIGWLDVYLTLRFSVGSEQLVSGTFLLIAVFMIRKFLVDHGMSHKINYGAMTLHGVSFSIYNLSIIFFYYFFYRFEHASLKSTDPMIIYEKQRDWFIAWIITTYTSFIA